MAAIDLQTIRGTVRLRGDYVNTQKFPDSYLNTEIQSAFTEFYELIADTYQGYWDTAANVTATTNVAFVALPADAWRVQAIDRLDGTDFLEMRQIGLEERNLFGSTTNKPAAYRLSSRGVELFPTPNATYTLRVTYTPIAPALAESTAREWYNGWEDYVITGALLRVDQRQERPLNERMAVLDRCRARIVSGAQRRRSQEPQYIPLREGPRTLGLFTWDLD